MLLFLTFGVNGQQRLWVGQSYKCDVTSSVMGTTADMSWSGDVCLSLSGSYFYRDVVVTDYFEGTQTVTCTWKYKLYYNDTWKTQTVRWNISCYENPLSISPTSMTLYVGQEDYIGYGHKYSNNYTNSARVSFSSSNSTIVSVNSSGKVTAKSPGTAYVNVHSSLASGSPYCLITVKEAVPTGVSLPATEKIIEGETKQLTPKVTPSGISTSYTWKSDNPDVVSVDTEGRIKGVKVGSTKIWVTTVKGGYTASCTVTVLPPPIQPTGVELPEKLSLYVGFGQTLTPKLSPDAAEADYIWKSSDNSVVKVDSKGMVQAVSKGNAVISVKTHNGLTAECKITVSDLPSEYDASAIKSKISVVDRLKTATFNNIN